MGWKMASPHRDPRTQILYFRRVIPADLRPFMGGRTEFKVSLETRDLSVAKPRFAAQASRYEQEAAAARLRLNESFSASVRQHVSDYFAEKDRAWLSQEWVQSLTFDADEDEATRSSIRTAAEEMISKESPSLAARLGAKLALLEFLALGHSGAASPDAVMRIGTDLGIAPLPDCALAEEHRKRLALLTFNEETSGIPGLESVKRLRSSGNFKPIESLIRAVGKHHGLAISAGDDAWFAVGNAVYDHVQAELESSDYEAFVKIAPAVLPVGGDHVTPVRSLAPTAVTVHGSGTPISKVHSDWERQTESRANVRVEWAAAIKQFIRAFGDVPVETITSDMVLDLRDLVTRLPRSPTRDVARLSPAEQVAYADKHDLPRVAAGTANKKMIALRSVLEHARDPMRLIQVSPCAGVKAPKGAKARDKRQVFELRDLTAILTTPMIEGGMLGGTRRYRRACDRPGEKTASYGAAWASFLHRPCTATPAPGSW